MTDDTIARTMLEAARIAGAITLPYFRSGVTIENKLDGGFDPVTEADRQAETAIRALISERFPDDTILGEEFADHQGTSSGSWIIDPIDGTRAFICGVPVWGTLIGYAQGGRPVAGMMAQPFTGEIVLASNGGGVWQRGGERRPLRTSAVERLEEARMTATTPELFLDEDHAAPWAAITQSVLQTRYGLDCYGYCLLAMGQIDLVVEAGLKAVDIAPLVPIIEAAGGVVTTWDGENAWAGGTCVAAATPALHAAAIKRLARS